MLDKLPEVLAERLMEVAEKVGPERAMIALQGLVNLNKTICLIDGVLRQETIDAVNHTIKVSGLDTLVAAYQEKIEHRFPGTFAVDEPDEEAVETPEIVNPRTRRVK